MESRKPSAGLKALVELVAEIACDDVIAEALAPKKRNIPRWYPRGALDGVDFPVREGRGGDEGEGPPST